MSDAISQKQATLLRTKIQGFVDAGKENAMDLCWACYEADTQMVRVKGQLEHCWKVWGYPTWEEYVGQEMGLHMTTAYAYKKIWEVFYVDFNGAWDKSLLLSITKMRLLSVAPLTKKNINTWLKRAAGVNCRKLRAMVYDTEELRNFSTLVTVKELERINQILDQGRDVYGEEDAPRGKVLVSILRDWAKKQRHLKTAA